MLEAAQSGHGQGSIVWFLVVISFLFGTNSRGFQQMPATVGMADVNGAKLYYEVKGEGRPLVLIHGGGIDSRMWDDHFEVLAEHYKVIRYDLRGSGKSDVPTKRWSHVEDLRSLLRLLRINEVYLLGLSRGAQVSADFIFEYPDMVDALILASPNLDGPPPAYENPGAKEAAREDISLAVDVMMKNPYTVPQREYEAARRKMRVMLEDNAMVSLFIYRNFHLQRPELPATRRIPAIGVPTLLIVGGKDHPDALANYDREAALIPGARKVVIPGVNHVAPMEKPEEFNQIVLDFLNQVGKK